MEDDRKKGLDRLANYSDSFVRKIIFENTMGSLYSLGDASYNLDDLMVVYKINRLFKTQRISEEEYYDLLEKYNTFLELNSRIEYYYYLKNYGLLDESNMEFDIDDMQEKLYYLGSDLSEVELLPEFVSLDHMIDASSQDIDIKLNRKKRDE